MEKGQQEEKKLENDCICQDSLTLHVDTFFRDGEIHATFSKGQTLIEYTSIFDRKKGSRIYTLRQKLAPRDMFINNDSFDTLRNVPTRHFWTAAKEKCFWISWKVVFLYLFVVTHAKKCQYDESKAVL